MCSWCWAFRPVCGEVVILALWGERRIFAQGRVNRGFARKLGIQIFGTKNVKVEWMCAFFGRYLAQCKRLLKCVWQAAFILHENA
jgi:hypothetical protein